MPQPLPPDLSRLGDELVRATERRTRLLRRRGERRDRIAAAGVAAVLAAGLLALQGDERPAGTVQVAAASTTVYRPVACDQPRGATFAAVRPCASPGSTDVEPHLMARRYAVQ